MNSIKMISVKSLLLILLISAAVLPLSAQALGLHEAKAQGLVGEQRNGLLGAVGTANADVSELITSINSKRMSAYRRIAKKNGTELSVVQQLAGKKAIEKTPTGQYIKPAGQWLQAR